MEVPASTAATTTTTTTTTYSSLVEALKRKDAELARLKEELARLKEEPSELKEELARQKAELARRDLDALNKNLAQADADPVEKGGVNARMDRRPGWHFVCIYMLLCPYTQHISLSL